MIIMATKYITKSLVNDARDQASTYLFNSSIIEQDFSDNRRLLDDVINKLL